MQSRLIFIAGNRFSIYLARQNIYAIIYHKYTYEFLGAQYDKSLFVWLLVSAISTQRIQRLRFTRTWLYFIKRSIIRSMRGIPRFGFASLWTTWEDGVCALGFKYVRYNF